MKKLTVFLSLIVLVCLMLFTASACAKKSDSDINTGNIPEEKLPVEQSPKDNKMTYSVVACVKGDIEIYDIANGCYNCSEDLMLIETFDQFSSYSSLSAGNNKYDKSFFESKSLVLMRFTYCSSEDGIEFKKLLLSGNKLCALFELDGRKQNEPSCDDIRNNLYSAEVEKESLKDIALDNIFVVNRREVGSSSNHYSAFNGIIK